MNYFFPDLRRPLIAAVFMWVASGTLWASELADPPTRIVSTSLAGDEILLDLLKSHGKLSYLVAVSTLADDPTYSNISDKIQSIKHRAGREIESTLALKPDLVVLASYNRPEMIRRFQAANVPTLVLSEFTGLSDIATNIRLVGKRIGLRKEADNMATLFEKDLNRIRKRWPRNRPKPTLINFSENRTLNGKETLFNDAVVAAGGRNLAAEKGIVGWAQVSVESLTTWKPDGIVVLHPPKPTGSIWKQAQGTKGYQNLSAVKNKRLFGVNGASMLSVSTHILPAIETLQEQLLRAPPLPKKTKP